MSDKGHIHTLIANREQQLYGALRDGARQFNTYLMDTISEICKTMNYDFRDLYLKIVFESMPNGKGSTAIKCKYCTSQHENAHPDDKYYILDKEFSAKSDILDYYYSRVIALDSSRRNFAESKLGAYRFDCSRTVSDSATLYEYQIVYLLGGQKITDKK